MHDAVAGDERAILHHDMTRQKRAIDDDDVIAQAAVVRYVAMRHEKILRPDQRVFIATIRAMHRDVLTEYIVIADAQPCGCVLVFEVLGSITEDAAGMDLVMRADGRDR